MPDRAEDAICRARLEYNRNGCLSMTTVSKLSNLGLIVPDLEAEFETEKN